MGRRETFLERLKLSFSLSQNTEKTISEQSNAVRTQNSKKNRTAEFERKPEERIEVVVGDVVDPSTFCMVQKNELKEIMPMENALTEEAPMLEKGEREHLKVGMLISVYSKEDKMWFRATVTDFYATLGGTEIDAYLLDHGLTIKGIKYPEFVRNLPSAFKRPEPFAFEFKLHGLVPWSSRKSRGHIKKWAEITLTVAHMAVNTYARAYIFVESRDSKGLPNSGKLIFELDPNKTCRFKKFLEFFEKGGYTSRLPIIDLNKAYVDSKFAKFLQSQAEADQPNRVHPNFSAMINYEKSERHEEPHDEEAVQNRSRELRRKELLRELDELIESPI